MKHSAFPVCICRLTLTWISSEISTKLLGMSTHLDRSSLTALDPISSDWSLRYPVSTGHSRHPSPTAFCQFLCPTPTRVPLPTFGHVEIAGTGLCLVSRQNRQRDRLLGGPRT